MTLSVKQSAKMTGVKNINHKSRLETKNVMHILMKLIKSLISWNAKIHRILITNITMFCIKMVFHVFLSFLFSASYFYPTLANFTFFSVKLLFVIFIIFFCLEHLLALQTKSFFVSFCVILKMKIIYDNQYFYDKKEDRKCDKNSDRKFDRMWEFTFKNRFQDELSASFLMKWVPQSL